PDALFTETVAPIFRARCIRCHNSEKPRGSLDLSTRERMLKGGEHGPALMPGDAGKSLLVALISGPEPKMPKQGARLTSEEIARVRYWIDQGAPWPAAFVLGEAKAKWKIGPDWWSLRKLSRPAIPVVRRQEWLRTP